MACAARHTSAPVRHEHCHLPGWCGPAWRARALSLPILASVLACRPSRASRGPCKTEARYSVPSRVCP
eukprot:7061106-Prymnesium_polylepis.1